MNGSSGGIGFVAKMTEHKKDDLNRELHADQQKEFSDYQIIKPPVPDRLQHTQPDGVESLEEKLTRIEDENKNLKVRQTVLLERLFQLEQNMKKDRVINRTKHEPNKWSSPQMCHYESENIDHLPPNNDPFDTEIFGNDLGPLYRYTKSNQYVELPLHNVVDAYTDCHWQKKNVTVYTPVRSATDLDHAQVINNHIPCSQTYLQNRSVITRTIPHMPSPVNISLRTQGQNRNSQLRKVLLAREIRERKPTYLGPYPNLNQYQYRSASDTSQQPQITGYQFEENIPRVQQSEAVSNNKVSYQPPFIKIPLNAPSYTM